MLTVLYIDRVTQVAYNVYINVKCYYASVDGAYRTLVKRPFVVLNVVHKRFAGVAYV